MTTDVQHRPATAPAAPISPARRLLGLGSVFGKAVRDARRPFLEARRGGSGSSGGSRTVARCNSILCRSYPGRRAAKNQSGPSAETSA